MLEKVALTHILSVMVVATDSVKGVVSAPSIGRSIAPTSCNRRIGMPRDPPAYRNSICIGLLPAENGALYAFWGTRGPRRGIFSFIKSEGGLTGVHGERGEA